MSMRRFRRSTSSSSRHGVILGTPGVFSPVLIVAWRLLDWRGALRAYPRLKLYNDEQGHQWWLVLFHLLIIVRSPPRNCLWGARLGDRQLATRTGIDLARNGLPAGATCISSAAMSDRYWLWIPVT